MRRISQKMLLVLIAIFLLPVELFAQEKTEQDRWDSSVGISYVAASGNSDAQTLSITGEANRKGYKNELGLKAGTVYGRSEGETTSEYWHANAQYNHDISKKAYWLGLLGLEGNELANYHLRFSAHPGIGYRFLENRHEIRGEIGPGYIFEDRIGDDDLAFVSGRAYAFYKFQLTKKAAFSQDAEYLHDFEDADDFRFNANTSLVVKISEWISLKTGISVQYVNEPPENAEDTDVFTSTSLIFTF